MVVYGFDIVQVQLSNESYFFKLLANESAVAIFSGEIQHRDFKSHGLSYEDDYRGNALAATVTPRRIDFRRHLTFSADRVRQVVATMLELPEFGFASNFQITYHGEILSRQGTTDGRR